jgi:hypothetical protein
LRHVFNSFKYNAQVPSFNLIKPWMGKDTRCARILQCESDARRRRHRGGQPEEGFLPETHLPTHRNLPSLVLASKQGDGFDRQGVTFRSDKRDTGEASTPDQHLLPSRCAHNRRRQPASPRTPPRQRVDTTNQPRATTLASRAPT